MDTSPLSSSGHESWAERFTTALDAQRKRAEEFVTAKEEHLREAIVFLQQQFGELEQSVTTARKELKDVQEERNALVARLAERKSAPQGSPNSINVDLQRRLELSQDEVQEANDRIADLQEQLTKARSSAARLAQQSRKPGWLDWESEKKRILAALEADEEDANPVRRSELLGVEEVLRMTDEIIAVKDREITDLKQRLEQRVGPGATDDSTIKQAINSDAVIQEERNRLQQLQKEWREKLREAEVELSVERAKIARERAELDEQIRLAQESQPKPAKSADAAENGEPGERSCAGRWLAQLGLTAADREPARR